MVLIRWLVFVVLAIVAWVNDNSAAAFQWFVVAELAAIHLSLLQRWERSP